MPSNFPNNPSVGTTHTIGDITWEWNGVAWIAVGGIGVLSSVKDGGTKYHPSCNGT